MTATEPSRHAIGDLARLAGVTPRTIRYYVAQGLLPGPTSAGPGAHYDARHLERLRLIKRLQRQHLPLAEIRARLTTLGDDEIAALNRTGIEDQAPASSALDYIRSVLGGPAVASPPEVGAPMPAPQPAPMPAPMAAPGAMPALLRRAMPRPAEPQEAPVMALREARAPERPEAAAEPTTEPTTEPTLERSQWERLSLGPNLELHIRRPLSRHEQRRVERLITIARQVLKEELP